MRSHSAACRSTAAAALALQLLGASLWPVVDARLEAAEQRAAAHIESEQAAPCAPSHDDVFCQVCRVGALAGNAPTAAFGAFDTAPIQRLAQLTDPDSPPQHTRSPAHSPRAPPLS